MKILVLFFIITCFSLHAQVTVTFQPGGNTGKDAEVWSLEPNLNYNHDLIRGNAWTWSGNPGIQRAFLEFDFAAIPAGAKIESALLSLYSPGSPNSQSHSGNNAAHLKRVITNWSETDVTWNNQPAATSLHQVSLPESTSDYQDYLNINVTQLVTDMFADPSNSYGFMLQLQSEDLPRRISFASSDHTNTNKLPKLVITFTLPACTSLILRPAEEGKDAEIFDLQPTTNFNYDTYRGNAWTFGGDLGVVRGLLEFDLSGLPANIEVDKAYLSLYAPDSPHSQFHSGDNQSFLLRITEPWNETTVNWNNQPATTNTNLVSLSASSHEYQNYLVTDVTDMVIDMLADPAHSYGFMLRQQTEEQFRRMTFASSDFPNPAKHPRLEVCYSASVDVKDPDKTESTFTITPNPAKDWIRVDWTGQQDILMIQLYDPQGRLVKEESVEKGNNLNLGMLPASGYLVRASSRFGEIVYQKSIIKL
jgi:hypothetical protein